MSKFHLIPLKILWKGTHSITPLLPAGVDNFQSQMVAYYVTCQKILLKIKYGFKGSILNVNIGQTTN